MSVNSWKPAFFSLCILSSSTLAAPSQPADLRFRIPAAPATLDWNLAHTSAETYVIMNLMEGLVEEGPDLKPIPALAESWTLSPDGKTYTFKIRKGVLWSDGIELKARHFVDSWLRLLRPATRSPYASFLFGIENAEAFHSGKLKDPAKVGVAAKDDHTLEVRLAKVVPHFLHVPTFWVTFPIRSDLIAKQGSSWAKPGKLVTLGPYLAESGVPEKSITLARNPKYRAEAAAAGRVRIDFVASDKTARESFRSGAHDLLLNATTADLLDARSSTGGTKVQLLQFPYLATYYLGFNVNAGPMRDVNFRRAVALSLTLPAFPEALQGGQSPATGWIPPGIEGSASNLVLQGSLYEAKSSLARAGYGEGAALPRLDLWIVRMDGADALGQVVSEALKRTLGIEVSVKVASGPEFQAAAKKGKAHLFATRWGLDFPDAASAMELFESKSGTNYTGWKSAEYDTWVEAGRSTLETKARLESYRNAEEILLQRDVVIAPLFYTKNAVLTGPRVRKLAISPLNYFFLKSVELTP